MAKQRKQLADAFTKLGATNNEEVAQPQATEQNEVTVNSNTTPPEVTESTVQTHEEPVVAETPVSQGTAPESITVAQVKQSLLSIYEEKTKKETVEDTHIRTTFLFRKDLAKRLDKLSRNKRGYKTLFLNQAIEALLNEMEN